MVSKRDAQSRLVLQENELPARINIPLHRNDSQHCSPVFLTWDEADDAEGARLSSLAQFGSHAIERFAQKLDERCPIFLVHFLRKNDLALSNECIHLAH